MKPGDVVWFAPRPTRWLRDNDTRPRPVTLQRFSRDLRYHGLWEARFAPVDKALLFAPERLFTTREEAERAQALWALQGAP